jgi:hypothetical protein
MSIYFLGCDVDVYGREKRPLEIQALSFTRIQLSVLCVEKYG